MVWIHQIYHKATKPDVGSKKRCIYEESQASGCISKCWTRLITITKRTQKEPQLTRSTQRKTHADTNVEGIIRFECSYLPLLFGSQSSSMIFLIVMLKVGMIGTSCFVMILLSELWLFCSYISPVCLQPDAVGHPGICIRIWQKWINLFSDTLNIVVVWLLEHSISLGPSVKWHSPVLSFSITTARRSEYCVFSMHTTEPYDKNDSF